MTKEETVGKLQKLNPRAPLMQLTMFAELYVEYRAATANIGEHGSVVLHPRTGEPTPNPYLPIRDKAMKVLQGFRVVTSPDMWA